jgi:DNA adenine methylase
MRRAVRVGRRESPCGCVAAKSDPKLDANIAGTKSIRGGKMRKSIRLFLCRYPGGKVRTAPWIIRHLPPHDRYVEAFAGAANVLLNKPRCRSEWLIERDAAQANLLRVVRDRNEEFAARLSSVAYAQEAFEAAGDRLRSGDWRDELDLAGLVYLVRQLSYGGQGVSYSRRRGPRIRRWWSGCLGRLPLVAARLQGVEIVEGDAVEWPRLLDGPRTLHYCDPPYLRATRSGPRLYRHELDDDGHRDLLGVLDALTGRVVLSGYPSRRYDGSLEGWGRVENERTLDSWHRGRRNRRTEVLWMS